MHLTRSLIRWGQRKRRKHTAAMQVSAGALRAQQPCAARRGGAVGAPGSRRSVGARRALITTPMIPGEQRGGAWQNPKNPLASAPTNASSPIAAPDRALSKTGSGMDDVLHCPDIKSKLEPR